MKTELLLLIALIAAVCKLNNNKTRVWENLGSSFLVSDIIKYFEVSYIEDSKRKLSHIL